MTETAELETPARPYPERTDQSSTQSSEQALADDQSLYVQPAFGGLYFAFALLVKGNSDSSAYVEQYTCFDSPGYSANGPVWQDGSTSSTT